MFASLVKLCMGKQLSILIYHRVRSSIDPICPREVNAATFEWHMKLVANNFNVLPLSEAISLHGSSALPAGSLCITFDDGYADNAENALPILKRFGLAATFFVSTGYLDGGRMWNDTVIEAIRNMPEGALDLTAQGIGKYQLDSWDDRRICSQSIIKQIKHLPQHQRLLIAEQLANLLVEPLPNDLMMTSEQVKELSLSGMDVGGHTVTHPILATLSRDDAKREISNGKKHLESIIGKQVDLFAYPNGLPGVDYLPEHVELVEELGFLGAVSTQKGTSNSNTNKYQLYRFTPWDNSPTKFLLRLLQNRLV